MKKAFLLVFISFAFGIFAVVLWAGTANAKPPFLVPPPGGGIQACYAQQASAVPQTGQMTSYADYDDGYFQAGMMPPDPRFTDNGDGTITDNLTHLIWLKDANCFGGVEWADALTSANTLNSGECGLTDGSVEGDWRLPNRNELTSLLDLGNYNPALPTGHPFVSFELAYYWSSTTLADGTNNAWGISFAYGFVSFDGKAGSRYVLPVRGGL
jgi:hypothetical protein